MTGVGGWRSFKEVGEYVETTCLRDAENRPMCHLSHACYRSQTPTLGKLPM